MKSRLSISKKTGVYLFCLLSALIPLAVCSKSSPLYPLNDWPDVNIFYTIGKGMVYGKVPYVDLLDHKGPYVYALAAVAYLLDHNNLYGFFLFEVISIYAFLVYTYKIIGLYCKKVMIWLLPLLSWVVVCAKSFVHGGSIEELSLGIFAYAIYSLLYFLKQGKDGNISVPVLMINGVWAGVLFWSKFTLLGLYMAWIAVVLICYLARRNVKGTLKSAGIFLGMMLCMALPWVIYFAGKHAVRDWLSVYLWNNIFGYTAESTTFVWGKVKNAVLDALRSLKDRGNRTYSPLVVVGCLSFVCYSNKRVTWTEKISVGFMGALMALGIFIGGTSHDYYGLPLAVFALFGIVLCNVAMEKINLKSGLTVALCAVMLLGGIGAAQSLSPNVYLLGMDRTQMPQYRFAKRILESEDASLLNYAFLDGGFYTVTEEIPQVRYFCAINMNRDMIVEKQNGYLKEGKTHWVVTWKAYEMSEEELKTLPILSQYYDLVDYQYFYFEGDMRTYALYEKKEN